MDPILIGRDGKQFTLAKNLTSPPPSGHSAGTTAELQTLLKNAKPLSPKTWAEVWAKLKPTSATAHKDEKDIIAALVQALVANKIHLKKQAAIASSSGTKGAPSGSSTSEPPPPLGPSVEDKPAEAFAVPGTEVPFSEKTAVASAEPTEGGDQAICDSVTSADPISMVSGEELLQFTDFTLAGPMPLQWLRTYRSSHSRDCGLGCGWTHTGSDSLQIDGHKVLYYDDEGRTIPFVLPKVHQRSKYLPEGLNLDRISEDGFILKKEGEWDKVFTRPNNLTHRLRLTQLRHKGYRQASTLLGVRTAEVGFAITLHYNANNRVAKIAGNWGRSLCFQFDDHGRIAQVALRNDHTKQQKNVAEYDYNDQGDLIAQRNAAGVGEQYAYNNHLLIQRTLRTGFSFYFLISTIPKLKYTVH